MTEVEKLDYLSEIITKQEKRIGILSKEVEKLVTRVHIKDKEDVLRDASEIGKKSHGVVTVFKDIAEGFFYFTIDTVKFVWRLVRWSPVLIFLFVFGMIFGLVGTAYDDTVTFIVGLVGDLLAPVDDVIGFINNDILPLVRDVVDILCKKIRIGIIHIGPILKHCPHIGDISKLNTDQPWFRFLQELECGDFDTAGKMVLQLVRLLTGSSICRTVGIRDVVVIGDIYWFFVGWLGWPRCETPSVGAFWLCFILNFGKMVTLSFWLTILFIWLSSYWKNWLKPYVFGPLWMIFKRCWGSMRHTRKKRARVLDMTEKRNKAHKILAKNKTE